MKSGLSSWSQTGSTAAFRLFIFKTTAVQLLSFSPYRKSLNEQTTVKIKWAVPMARQNGMGLW